MVNTVRCPSLAKSTVAAVMALWQWNQDRAVIVKAVRHTINMMIETTTTKITYRNGDGRAGRWSTGGSTIVVEWRVQSIHEWSPIAGQLMFAKSCCPTPVSSMTDCEGLSASFPQMVDRDTGSTTSGPALWVAALERVVTITAGSHRTTIRTHTNITPAEAYDWSHRFTETYRTATTVPSAQLDWSCSDWSHRWCHSVSRIPDACTCPLCGGPRAGHPNTTGSHRFPYTSTSAPKPWRQL